MKKSILTLCIAFMTAGLFAQTNVIDRHFDNYRSHDDFTSIAVTGKMFQLAGHLEMDDADPELQEFLDFVSSVTSFNMVMGEKVPDTKGKFNSAIGIVERDFEELMSVHDKDGDFLFYIDETNGVVNELVGIGASVDHFFIFSLNGSMDLKQISQMGSKLHEEGFGKLDNVEKKALHEIKVYPNPAERNAEFNIELPKEMIGADLTMYNMNGGIEMKQVTTKRRIQVKTNKLSAGTYVLEMVKDGVSVKRKVTVR